MSLIEKLLDLENPKKEEDVMSKPEIKKAKFHVRTLGSAVVTAEAQRIYNPALPPTKTKGPTEAQQEVGTSAALDTSGNWGKPDDSK